MKPPFTTEESTQTWNYTYAPYTNYRLTEVSPLSKTKTWTYNNHGNVLTYEDELHHVVRQEGPNNPCGHRR